MGRTDRLKLFGTAAEAFFAGVDWLAAPAGLPGLALQVGAAFTQLIVDQGQARFEAVVDQPIGVMPAGYDVPGPDEVFDWFEFEPEPPEIREVFAPEIEAGDWRALQHAHRVIHEIHVLKRPILRRIFARELAAGDWRTIVDEHDAARTQVNKLLASPKARNALKDWYGLVTGNGPERTNADAQARLSAHWSGLVDTIKEALS
ncbi:MAG: hypothetical protein KC549_09675 [Myxococcales bacterium]|nr:hypothetical protein [Myxococcales bacterium]MCB9548102.1 hypothetical protein [Myxococcales bacterium]